MSRFLAKNMEEPSIVYISWISLEFTLHETWQTHNRKRAITVAVERIVSRRRRRLRVCLPPMNQSETLQGLSTLILLYKLQLPFYFKRAGGNSELWRATCPYWRRCWTNCIIGGTVRVRNIASWVFGRPRQSTRQRPKEGAMATSSSTKRPQNSR